MKNLFLFGFAVICLGFFFYVVATQVIQPMMFPGANTPQYLDPSQILSGYIQKVLQMFQSK